MVYVVLWLDLLCVTFEKAFLFCVVFPFSPLKSTSTEAAGECEERSLLLKMEQI
eukprot:m.163729 g.163729  ORF g.163729 m.163729 type:complete len:54 (-) comp15217_c1_seq4:1581-1742(-)